MKKENIILVLAFGLMVILSLIMLGIQGFFPTTELDKMFNQKVVVSNEQAVVDPEFVNIVSKADVSTLGGAKLADLYTVRVDHTYFYMELYVAIDASGKVYARDKVVRTKDSTSQSYFPIVREYLLKNYSGLYYENIKYIDGAAGATTITVSRSIIKNTVSRVVLFHVGEPVDYVKELFGKDYDLVSTETFGHVNLYNVSVDGVSYRVFEAKDSGTYYDFQSTNEGEITIYVAIDTTGTIKFVSIPETLYGHSGGNFYNQTKAFLESVLDQQISSNMPDSTTGPTANSNGSQFLVNLLLKDIQEVA